MIVYCEKCKSKFQVDDAKIPEAGIKARCSVCAHAFLLKKEPAAVSSVAPAQEKSVAGAGEFDAAIFGESSSGSTAVIAPATVTETTARQATTSNNSTFFSRNPGGAETKPAKESANHDIVVEIDDGGSFDNLEDVYEAAEQSVGKFAEVSSTGKSSPVNERQAKAEEPKSPAAQHSFFSAEADQAAVDVEMSKFGFASRRDDTVFSASEPAVQKAAAETTTTSTMRFPEVMPSAGGQLPSNQVMGKPEREIINLLEECGMTDDYVVQMVQEICKAVKYVEGVEKPDWPTRMMGLEMLCKIKGLYAGEKKEDPTNRQVQIVTGINM